MSNQRVTYENLEKREKTVKVEMQSTISELDSARMQKSDMGQTFGEIESKKNSITVALDQIKIKKQEKYKESQLQLLLRL